MSALTIEDIRNPSRKSGFDHVNEAGAGNSGLSVARMRAWRAQGRRLLKRPGPAYEFRGPNRTTPEEAAQDYCDYINGSGVSPAPQVKTAGHGGKRSSASAPPEVLAAQGVLRDWRGQQQGKQGYVYCIAEAEGLSPLVKIGYSTNPQARLTELQTGNGRLLFLLAYFAGTIEDERALHAKYIEDNTLQEWFRPSDQLLSEFGYDTYDLYAKGSAAR